MRRRCNERSHPSVAAVGARKRRLKCQQWQVQQQSHPIQRPQLSPSSLWTPVTPPCGRHKVCGKSPWVVLLVVSCLMGPLARASEFPERECCDPVYPPIPDPEPLPPGSVLPTTTISTSSSGGGAGGSGGISGFGGLGPLPGGYEGAGSMGGLPEGGLGAIGHLGISKNTIGYSGSNIKTAIAILNCILARQLCFEDPSCSAILEIIPRVCGPVPVACSTVTVTKCQAALRTLQAFPFFRPTCLCKEPGIDPECNYFRDFLFDHPCGFVSKKEKDPYPVDALPTCNHALSVCQQERKCIKLFEDFKTHCKVRENKCRMEDRELCYEAWTNLRLSPMFGCICPNNHMKRRCDKIFSVVNHNPCVDVLPSALDTSSGTATNSIYPNFYPSDVIEDPPPTSTYPYFLFPSRKYPPSAFQPAVYSGADYINVPAGSTNHSQHRSSTHLSPIDSTAPHQPPTQHHFSYNQYEHNFDSTATSNKHGKHQHPASAPPISTNAGEHQPQRNDDTMAGGTPWSNLNVPPDLRQRLEIVGSDDIEEKEAEMSFIHFQSTCHLALDACRDDQVCSSALKTVLMHCELHRCNRNACMESLQSFYKGIHDDLSLDIAFCLCRKTPNRHDSCMIAQEKLHPACAQHPPENLNPQTSNGVMYGPPPSCHAVAEMCREDEDCRARLEVFEQSCAVDSVTKKCAGKTSACRQAMLGILGTPLRTSCACQGSEVQQLYDCLGWQKLLWLNPCVVESQKDFHLKRLAELGLLTTTTTTTTTTTMRPTLPPTLPPTKPKPVYRPKPTEMLPPETNHIETPDTRSETLVQKGNELISRTDLDPPPPPEEDHDDLPPFEVIKNYQRPDEQILQIITTEVVDIEPPPPTTTTTTTTEPTTTPVPIRYCVVQRSHQSDQLIAEGKSRRLYMLDDAECSELCACGGGESLALSCHALCVPLAPCRTSLAYYSHAAPAYQAFRGRCLCYSGRFICMRPPPGEYSLPGGIFLLLGYSSTDEALLRPHTNLGVQDAVRALQQYVVQHINNETSCTLTLFNITDENIILSIRLPHDPKLSNIELLKLEKDHCTKILETISHQINTQHVEMSAHRLLSIFKMAEVQVVWPEVSGARPSLALCNIDCHLLALIVFATIVPFMRWRAQHATRRSVT
ncbi:uncharacterized protein LOC129761802 isoform X2 [Toxorhynchites rutilus septentrionalis]|uniref:uncharacterized protein LOC129761802 isoform X2 n=1 Tax=Toxorhynchites rutilus septentrionalis TaxID=329112 RepID=UPI00247AEEFA|nr:uncharacterized protein LOC129761802 isoform X2 [Toxorhynchites rutilus septentrionalis]